MKKDIAILFENCNSALDAGNCLLAYSFLKQVYPLLLNYTPKNILWAFYHLNLASVYNNMGRFQDSRDCCHNADKIIPFKGYEDLKAKIESSLASSYLNNGDFEKSFEHANNALRLYNKVNIEQLPTILSILDQIAGEEEGLRNNPISSFFSNLGAEIDHFIDRLRSSEFELLLQTHPFVKLVYENGISFINFGEDVWVKLKIDSIGLAQHYQLETDMIDLTSDKWVAAFFATCIKKKGRYLPIDEIEDNLRVGVVYRYCPLPYIKDCTSKNKFSVIGLQPFKRPGEQKGFALQLGKGENLNKVNGIEKYFFRHDKLAAEIIYNRMNQGKELFPYDELEEYAKKIKNSKKISNSAFQLAYEKYPVKQMDIELLRSACISKGIKFVNFPIVNFPKGLENVYMLFSSQ